MVLEPIEIMMSEIRYICVTSFMNTYYLKRFVHLATDCLTLVEDCQSFLWL